MDFTKFTPTTPSDVVKFHLKIIKNFNLGAIFSAFFSVICLSSYVAFTIAAYNGEFRAILSYDYLPWVLPLFFVLVFLISEGMFFHTLFKIPNLGDAFRKKMKKKFMNSTPLIFFLLNLPYLFHVIYHTVQYEFNVKFGWQTWVMILMYAGAFVLTIDRISKATRIPKEVGVALGSLAGIINATADTISCIENGNTASFFYNLCIITIFLSIIFMYAIILITKTAAVPSNMHTADKAECKLLMLQTQLDFCIISNEEYESRRAALLAKL